MSNLSAGPILRGRQRSRISPSVVGFSSPERMIDIIFTAAPGAVGAFVFVAPRACKITRVDYVADVNGAGASKVFLRKHVAGQTAAANAATSGSNIVDVVPSGIAADSTVRVPTNPALTAANTTMAAGDKLALVTPATWVGSIMIYWVML